MPFEPPSEQALSQAQIDAVMERRARALAAAPQGLAERRKLATVALVGVGGETFGVPVDGMREIVRAPVLAPLPGLPAWLPGIVQIRGEILSVVDLARWFGIAVEGQPHYLVVLSDLDAPLALLVDAVLGFRDVHEDELASGLAAGGRPLLAITADLVCVLDLPALVRSDDLHLSAAPRSSSAPASGAR